MLVLLKCQTCGKDFKVHPCRSHKARFCSRRCYHAGNVTHGGSNTRLYTIWRGMRARCENPDNKHFAYYGAKGVTVCGEWSKSFAAFRDWALANGYRDDLTLDRRKGEHGYSPENCRWATMGQQVKNRGKYANGLTSRFKGVSFRPVAGDWKAEITSDGVYHWLGAYAIEEDAARAYDEAARRLFGEFASLNFKD